MAEPLPGIDLETIAIRRKMLWMRDARKHLSIQERIALSVPWWLIIIFIGVVSLSASHTAALFSQLSSIGYAGPFVVEFALLWAAFLRVTANQRISAATRVLEILAFVMAIVANGVGAGAQVAHLAGIESMSWATLWATYGTLPFAAQATILVVPLFAVVIPVGTWVAGESMARLVLQKRTDGDLLERKWADVQVIQLAQALYAELIKSHEPADAKRKAASMSTGYYNVMRTPVRLDSPQRTEVRAIPEVSTVSAATVHKPVHIQSRTEKPSSNVDMRKAVRDYLDGHPEAASMSVRVLASTVGVSKSLAAEELSKWKEGGRA